MEKIKPVTDAQAIKARMLKDENGTLVRVAVARMLFLWTGLVFFTLVLASIGGIAAGNDTAQRLLSQGVFVTYPAFLLSLATLTHAGWAHAAYVRRGAKSIPIATVILGCLFLLFILPHFGFDALFLKNTTGLEISDRFFRDLLVQVKNLIP